MAVAHYLLTRSYPDTKFVSVWLCRRDGAAVSSLLYGECTAAAVEEIARVTGLKVVSESSPLPVKPSLKPKGKK